MPKQAIFYLTVIILAGLGSLGLAAKLLAVDQSWASALDKVKENNIKQAASLIAQKRSAQELQSALAQANLGWDQRWDAVKTNPKNDTLEVSIGSNDGVSAVVKPGGEQAPRMLHAFQPAAEGYVYVGPFLALPANIRDTNTRLVPGWQLLLSETGSETSTWRAGEWRFRTQIPSDYKVRFEALVARFGTNLQTLSATKGSLQKQEVSFQAAEEQLQQRDGELVGGNDPDAAVDPRRPELTKGLVEAIDGEEESRNIIQIEIDELRRQILEVKGENDKMETELSGSPSSALDVPARIGSRPE